MYLDETVNMTPRANDESEETFVVNVHAPRVVIVFFLFFPSADIMPICSTNR